MDAIDTHLHVWSGDFARYPFAAGRQEAEPAPVELLTQTETVAVEPAIEDPATAEPAAEAESAAMQTAESLEPIAEEVAVIEAEPVQSGGLIAPSGSDKLRVTVIADTWADIKDSSDYQMVYDLLRADQSLELIGAAPFTVFLGNGHGVEIEINGEQYDFSFRIRDDNTARLKINR